MVISPLSLLLAVLGSCLLNLMSAEARSPSLNEKQTATSDLELSLPLLLQQPPPNYYQQMANDITSEEDYKPALNEQQQRPKRRLVVRVPFVQNPDTTHLSRIYRQLFTQQKQKKLISPFGYSIRNYIV